MELNEVKKILYKEKPIAYAYRTAGERNGKMCSLYIAKTSIGEIKFMIPFDERPEGGFKNQEQAQLLIRWIDM